MNRSPWDGMCDDFDLTSAGEIADLRKENKRLTAKLQELERELLKARAEIKTLLGS